MITAFLIHGNLYDRHEFVINHAVTQPQILSHLSDPVYDYIHSLLLDNPDQNLALVSHIYVDTCSKLSYVMFLLTPMIALLIVFRISYGWKASKAVKMHQPGRFFKGQEIRMFVKKNVKFVKMTITALLSIMCVQTIGFLLFYFVCPWRDFTYQSTLERVLSVQLYIVYPIAQAMETGTMFYLLTCYLRYRRNQ